MRIGADYSGSGKCEFVVWSPVAEKMEVKILDGKQRIIPMHRDEEFYWKAEAENIKPGQHYFYRINGETDRSDPASNSQPMDVHGPSEIIDHSAYKWTDNAWQGIPLTNYIIYEMHIGTFTPEGTFDAAAGRLNDLKTLGITAVEIMPVSQFPGERNWGYDGVYPFAVQSSYGGVKGLKHFVDECHSKGLAVVLDVVYNHFGPAGNYLHSYGPYFTSKYRTPWGDAVNFDEEYSDGVRNYFIENVLYWFRNFHIDSLRLDAVHSMYDFSAKHILEEMTELTDHFSKAEGKKHFLILESDLNDVRVINPREIGGYGCHAQWSDDFHHALHTLLTGEKSGYYMDFGKVSDMAKALKGSFIYTGQFSRSRKRRHGNDPSERHTFQFVVSTQNHDQIGNRAFGERLSSLVTFEAAKLAAGVMLLSPYIPMLFMGEEYAGDTPFQYFVSHNDPVLVKAVQDGRKQEFKAFKWKDEVPDPQSEETFMNSKLNWNERLLGKHKVMLEFYKELIRLRNTLPALKNFDRNDMQVREIEEEKVIFFHRWKQKNAAYMIMNFNDMEVAAYVPTPKGTWKKVLDSADEKWMGYGSQMPEVLDKMQDVTIKEFSLALYELQVKG
ncbi:MAG TPA: malto-oligosyltrehalose trehalohydrolase [Ignavibacteriales bacterium]|nr:malto-oligosyltrehalose trehalohydrolase [Ignavibacteriales bacterium]